MHIQQGSVRRDGTAGSDSDKSSTTVTARVGGGQEAAGAKSWGVGGWCVGDGPDELYCIQRPDGRICLGGARSLEPDAAVGSMDDSTLSTVVGGRLRSFLEESFPQLATGGATGGAMGGAAIEVEAEWTGVLGFTTDDKPVVGPVEGRPGSTWYIMRTAHSVHRA
jgi:glycine/D-amino acid oxidase-like deaminating enzyme